jgi:hypothetical protein
MSTVVESLQSERSVVGTDTHRGPLHNRMPAPRARPHEHRWKSALNAEDLQCLLQVIEGELIPRLVTEYSPARQAPLRVDASTG